MSRMPQIYRQPTGSPLRWQDDVSGILPQAVHAFIDEGPGRAPATSVQVELVRDYCEYFINAPCWHEGDGLAFAELRARIKDITTARALAEWLSEALEEGIDPL